MKKLIYLLISLFVLNSCTNGFEELNTNPNEPEIIEAADQFLPSIIFDLSQITSSQAYHFTDIISQYAASYEFNNLDLYEWTGDDRFWSPMYSILENIKDFKNHADATNNINHQAIALVLQSYIYSIITDAYGDVPMTEANKTAEGIVRPKYDKQETIYKTLLENLNKANQLLSSPESIDASYDILYRGDMLKWKKFANSLRLRLLLHSSSVQDVSEELSEIINNPTVYPVFESNADNAIYNYSGSFPNISSVTKPGGGRDYDYFLRVPTQTFIDAIKENDPRLELWVSPRDCSGENAPADCSSDRLQGVLPGLNVGDIGRPNEYSSRSIAFFESPVKIQGIFLTYSEINFIKAEVVQAGFVSIGSAKEYYEKAVSASFEQWGLITPSNFLTETAPYDASSEVLYVQKWIALYHTGIESWSEIKRTGKPSFIKAGPASTNDNKMPVRLLYPSLEQSVNSENYNKATADMGGDNLNSSSWWW
ncbi:MAG: SusD/RagB family nutrient-binding outer membrane lipoprotein [Tenacibaculum sp.]